MVGLLCPEVLRWVLPAADGIKDDGGACQVQQDQHLGECRELMRRGLHGSRFQHQPALAGVGANRVQGRPTVDPVVRTPGGLAVQGHHPTPAGRAVPAPTARTRYGDPAKLFHLHPGVDTTDNGSQGRKEDGCEWVPARVDNTVSDTPFRQVLRNDTIQGTMTGTHRWQEGAPILDNPPRNGIWRLPCLFDTVAGKVRGRDLE